jgi:hypothetical protein
MLITECRLHMFDNFHLTLKTEYYLPKTPGVITGGKIY